MPVEGLQTTDNGTQGEQPAASDATAENTGVQTSGTGTQPAQPTEATATQEPEKKFTQADVDRIVQNRLKSAVKAEIKKLTGEGDGTPTVEDLQRQLSEQTSRIRSFEARETVQQYLADGRNNLNIKPENIRAIQDLVIPRLEYGDDGKPSNLKDAMNAAKSDYPTLFENKPPSVNAGSRTPAPLGNDMNSFIRQAAGISGN